MAPPSSPALLREQRGNCVNSASKSAKASRIRPGLTLSPAPSLSWSRSSSRSRRVSNSLANLVRPLLSPLATTGLIVLFLVFILLRREDLRDRFLKLAGAGDLQRTTAALDDAGQRLSSFFLMQTLLNAGFGIVIAAGLAVIGVPHATLWGILAGFMRFVPFIGSFIAAFFPVVLAAAADPGWNTVLCTVGLFLVAEPIAGQVIEPVLYGHHTGLSPVAIVVATLFWALVWGPIGLLLATPLTVCLVVLGKHIDALNFIDVLLGDEPALEIEQRFYQRLLAADATEASDLSEQQLKKLALSDYYDAVPMKALILAQHDAAQGKLSQEKQLQIRDTVEDVVDAMKEYSDKPPTEKAVPADDATSDVLAPTKSAPPPDALDGREPLPTVTMETLSPSWRVTYPILCIASSQCVRPGSRSDARANSRQAWNGSVGTAVYRRLIRKEF